MGIQQTIVIWLLAINIVTVGVFRYDKMIAGSSRSRIPERNLLLLALFDGSLGAYIAMFLWRPRHKAQKGSFQWKYWAIVVGQIVLLGGYWQFWQRP